MKVEHEGTAPQDKNKEKRVALVGGGLDSNAYMALELNQGRQDADLLFCTYDQQAYRNELSAICALADALEWQGKVLIRSCKPFLPVIPKDSLLLGTGTNAFLPGRNLAFILAAIKDGYKHIEFTLTKERGPMFPDADASFIRVADDMVKRCYGDEYSVTAPYINDDKFEVVRRAEKVWRDLYPTRTPDFLDTTFTCWTPVGLEECGECAHCLKKKVIQQYLDDKDEEDA